MGLIGACNRKILHRSLITPKALIQKHSFYRQRYWKNDRLGLDLQREGLSVFTALATSLSDREDNEAVLRERLLS